MRPKRYVASIVGIAFLFSPPPRLALIPTQNQKIQVLLANQWVSVSDAVKAQIRSALLTTLASATPDVRHTAALVIAKVSAIEIPRSAWPELIPSLLNNANTPSNPAGLRHATLEALGYVCEELGALDEDYLTAEQVNAILTAVVAGMRPDETDMELRIAATTALNNALEFAHTNFSNDAERNYIMQMVCHGTQASDPRVRHAAWECLVRIASYYYSKLPAYMTDVFALSQQTVRSDEEEVALQALEFWSTVAEEEAQRDSDAGGDGTAAAGNTDEDAINHHFVAAALPQLVPLLLEQLTKQEEGADGDDGAWNPALAAGTALGLAALAVGDPISERVMPFVQENIQRNGSPEDWRAREAATFAFGSILEGLSVESLANLSRAGLGFLLAALKDPSPQVRNTTAWTLGRIFECASDQNVSPPLLDGSTLGPVVTALLQAIRDETHIAEKVCYALSQLASVFRDSRPPSPLSPYFEQVVGALLETASRPVEAGDGVRLQMQAFEAVNEVVRASSSEAAELVARLLPVGVGKLAECTTAPPSTPEAAERLAEVQGLLCGVLQVAIQKLNEHDDSRRLAAQQADSVMRALLTVLTWRPHVVHEEALLAVGALTYTCGRDFAKYLDAFFPVLERGLQQFQNWQTCQFAVTTIGDICRAVEEQVLPYCDGLMTLLLQNLQNNEVHRAIKPHILSAFGDVALAIGDRFEVYLSHVLQVLEGAGNLCVEQAVIAVQNDDEDGMEYVNSLRQGILDAWTGLFNGLSKPRVDQYLRNSAPALIVFVESIAQDERNKDSSVWRTAAALLGDVASSLSGVGALFRQKPFVRLFLQHCGQLGGMEETAKWALHMVAAAEASVAVTSS